MYAVTCVSLCRPAYAQVNGEAKQCAESILELVGDHFGVNGLSYWKAGLEADAEKGTRVIDAACKVRPGDKSRTIASVTYDAGVKDEKRLLVAVVDTSHGKVIAAYAGAIQEDATMTVGQGSLRIDTGRYDLAPGVRAFGIDVDTSYHQGCVDGGYGPFRTLFIQQGKAIRPVLEGFKVSTWSFVKGGPSCQAGDEVVIETISYQIEIGKTVTKGFADLRVTSFSSYDDGKKPVSNGLAYTLQYDGKIYPIQP
jgi:hypothetical protein